MTLSTTVPSVTVSQTNMIDKMTAWRQKPIMLHVVQSAKKPKNNQLQSKWQTQIVAHTNSEIV